VIYEINLIAANIKGFAHLEEFVNNKSIKASVHSSRSTIFFNSFNGSLRNMHF